MDNVPGVPKVGPKTARTLLEQFGTLDNVLANADKAPFLVASDSLNLTITGIKQQNLQSSVGIYPSISRTGEFTVLTNSETKIEKVEIFDANGKNISVQNQNEDSINGNFVITGKSGNYYIRIVTNKGVTIKKVLKL